MGLVMSASNHWQLADGGDLYSGDLIELYLDGAWIPGRVEFRPRKEYILVLDNGQVWEITEDLVLRRQEYIYYRR